MDYFIKGTLLTNSEAIGEIPILLKVFLSRVMHCLSGLGTRVDSTLLFSTTARFCDIKQQRNCSFLSSRLIQTTGSLVINESRVFNDFIVKVKSYMEVFSETPIWINHPIFRKGVCPVPRTIEPFYFFTSITGK